ncbi:gamma-aminobutyric acid receptor subunit alpha-2-like [Macrobrachium nipponense]|uniref:gamma-aminobutyric acid receptor subunit alpha-2-like n=1 Tax=Macrobrachium nipponense TaxID=159736 RepID=UPI0030C89CF0
MKTKMGGTSVRSKPVPQFQLRLLLFFCFSPLATPMDTRKSDATPSEELTQLEHEAILNNDGNFYSPSVNTNIPKTEYNTPATDTHAQRINKDTKSHIQDMNSRLSEPTQDGYVKPLQVHHLPLYQHDPYTATHNALTHGYSRPAHTYSHSVLRHARPGLSGSQNTSGFQNDHPNTVTQPLPLAQRQVTSRSSSDMAHLSHNISAILENLLKNYNNQVRPGYHEGRTTLVKFSLLIRSMGPISEQEMKYSMECYMRQEWSDDRLRFNGPLKQLTLNIKMLEALWKPDTYFHNGLGSYVHMTTRPNKLIRINQNGDLLYSMRLTIKAKCPMVLRNFPMDKQSCPLVISSYGYTEKDVKYIWDKKLVSFTPGMGLSQFDILNTKCTNYSVRWRTGRGMYSALQVNFNLSRSAGYFLIQVYVPCILIVVLSWVSFWINREATSDRVGLGITTVLTLSTISLDSRTDLPKVHYATALDWFILMSFGYCIATLLQFACVHFFTKVGSGEIATEEDEWEDIEIVEDCDMEELQECMQHAAYDISTDNSFDASVDGRREIVFVNSNQHNCPSAAATLYATLNSEAGVLNHAGDSLATFRSTETQTEKKESCWSQCYHCVLGDDRYRRERQRMATLQRSVNSVSVIDTLSRVLFPLSYGLLNVWYWYSYYDTELVFNWTNPGFAHIT